MRLGHQVRSAILIWVMTFVWLGSVAFLLKIGALFSRGTVLLYFLSGIALTALVRCLAARSFQVLTASRALARARVVAVGECNELRRNRTLGMVISSSGIFHFRNWTCRVATWRMREPGSRT
jgi:putative colanic acid biosynthesis UDP-glucose lipid carrier transferase